MTRPEEPVEGDIEMKEMKEPLTTNGKLEGTYSPLEQETHLRMGELDADNQNLENGQRQRRNGYLNYCCCFHGEALLKKKKCTILVIILAIAFAMSVGFNIKQHKEIKKLQTTLASLCPSDWKMDGETSLCPSNWKMDGETCYFFSDTQQTWNFSQSYCSSYGGSLLTNRSNQEWEFIKNHRHPAEVWINLRRNTLTDPWKWPNGSLVDSRIGGEGLCAYLNERGASSTLCHNTRHWICSKPVSHT